jgi:hypothetical protein
VLHAGERAEVGANCLMGGVIVGVLQRLGESCFGGEQGCQERARLGGLGGVAK